MLNEICNEEEIILLGLLPSKVFKYISESNSVTLLEAKEFSVFLLRFYNYYQGSLLTQAIETVENLDNRLMEKFIENYDKNSAKYFKAVNEILKKFNDCEKNIVFYLIKELSIRIAKASCEFYGAGAQVSGAEIININDLFSYFGIEPYSDTSK